MTTHDRTEQRLLASIRKAKKTGIAEKRPPRAEEASAPEPQDAPTATSSGESPMTSRGGAPSTDPYQLGRRVWPD